MTSAALCRGRIMTGCGMFKCLNRTAQSSRFRHVAHTMLPLRQVDSFDFPGPEATMKVLQATTNVMDLIRSTQLSPEQQTDVVDELNKLQEMTVGILASSASSATRNFVELSAVRVELANEKGDNKVLKEKLESESTLAAEKQKNLKEKLESEKKVYESKLNEQRTAASMRALKYEAVVVTALQMQDVTSSRQFLEYFVKEVSHSIGSSEKLRTTTDHIQHVVRHAKTSTKLIECMTRKGSTVKSKRQLENVALGAFKSLSKMIHGDKPTMGDEGLKMQCHDLQSDEGRFLECIAEDLGLTVMIDVTTDRKAELNKRMEDVATAKQGGSQHQIGAGS